MIVFLNCDDLFSECKQVLVYDFAEHFYDVRVVEILWVQNQNEITWIYVKVNWLCISLFACHQRVYRKPEFSKPVLLWMELDIESVYMIAKNISYDLNLILELLFVKRNVSSLLQNFLLTKIARCTENNSLSERGQCILMPLQSL